MDSWLPNQSDRLTVPHACHLSFIHPSTTDTALRSDGVGTSGETLGHATLGHQTCSSIKISSNSATQTRCRSGPRPRSPQPVFPQTDIKESDSSHLRVGSAANWKVTVRRLRQCHKKWERHVWQKRSLKTLTDF